MSEKKNTGKKAVIAAVSYTHLDVYKRQHIFLKVEVKS